MSFCYINMRLADTFEHHWAQRHFIFINVSAVFNNLEQELCFIGWTLLPWFWHVIGTLPAWRDYAPVGGRTSNWLQNHRALCRKQPTVFMVPCPETVIWSFLSSTYLTAMLLLIFLIIPACYGVVAFGWVTAATSAVQEITKARNPQVFGPAARHRSIFSTRRVCAWVTLPWGVYAGQSLGRRSCRGQHDE